MRIPEVRDRLKDMSTRLHLLGAHYDDLELGSLAKELLELAIELYRRPAVKRAPVKAKRMTPKLRAELKAFGEAHPEMLNREIGEQFGVDGGRVTDAMRGKRK